MKPPKRVALVPGVLAFLPQYAGIEDPVPDVRSAALTAVGWLAEVGPVRVVADPQGARVARHLLALVGATEGEGSADLVVANGSARLTDASPGYVDDRALPFDEALETALRTPDPAALAGLDTELGVALLVGNPDGLVRLGELLVGARTVVVDYAAAPFGVGYWVVRWESAPGSAPESSPGSAE